MASPTDALVLDLVEWVARAPRPYAEVMAAWRTSCPRLPVWEECIERGLVERTRLDDAAVVRVTSAGMALLQRAGRSPKSIAAAA